MENNDKIKIHNLLKFLLISSLGLIIFTLRVIPGTDDTILLFIIHLLQSIFFDYMPVIAFLFTFFSVLFTIILKFSQNSKISNMPFMKKNFNISSLQFFVRLSAFILCFLYLLRDYLPIDSITASSGEMIELCGNIIIWFVVANMVLPLLSDFGLAEFLEVFLAKIIKPLFTVPSFGIINIMTSFFVSSNMAMFLTGIQYEEGIYNKKESLKIMTSLAVPSIPTCMMFWALFGEEEYFSSYYMMVILVFFTLSLIVLRLPPLSTKEETYITKKIEKPVSQGNLMKRALTNASIKASKTTYSISRNLKSITSLLLSFIPFIIALGSLLVFILNNSRIIDVLSYPFAQYLRLFGIEEYIQAAPSFILNFADLAMPAVVLKDIASINTRIIMGSITINILIFIASILIITSFRKLTTIKELLGIMIIRIILVVPIAVVWGKILL